MNTSSSEEYDNLSYNPFGIIYVRINTINSIMSKTEYAVGNVHDFFGGSFGKSSTSLNPDKFDKVETSLGFICC